MTDGLRVNVAQGPGPGTWFGEASSVRVILEDVDGQVAEVQVARVGTDIVVVAAGLWGHTVNDRGHLLVSVGPTPGRASGPESQADWYGHAAHPEVRE